MNIEILQENDAREPMAALDVWDGEGGAGIFGPQECETSRRRSEARQVDAGTMKLHARIIALENLAVLLLASAPANIRQQARDIAIHILPRPGRTRHPLTLRAVARMNGTVDRAVRLNNTKDVSSAMPLLSRERA